MYFSDYFIYISCIFTFFRQSQLLFSLRFFNTRPWRYWSHHIWSKFKNLKTIVNKFSRNPCVHKNKNMLKTTPFYINHSIIWSCTSDMLLPYFDIKWTCYCLYSTIGIQPINLWTLKRFDIKNWHKEKGAIFTFVKIWNLLSIMMRLKIGSFI